MTAAEIYAQAKADELKKTLSNLYTTTDEQYSALENKALTNKQQILDSLKSTYDTGARSAYVTSVLNKNNLRNELNRIGLNSGGFGINQLSNIDTSYSQSRDTLLKALTEGTSSAESDYSDTLSGIASDKAKDVTDLTKYITEQGQDAYQTGLSNYLSLNQKTSSGSSGSSKKIVNLGNDKEPVVAQNLNGNSSATAKATDYYMSNGYQPSYVNNQKVTTFKTTTKNNLGKTTTKSVTVGDIFSNPGVSSSEKVYQAGSGKTAKFYVWIGSDQNGQYVDITSQVNNSASNFAKTGKITKQKWS